MLKFAGYKGVFMVKLDFELWRIFEEMWKIQETRISQFYLNFLHLNLTPIK